MEIDNTIPQESKVPQISAEQQIETLIDNLGEDFNVLKYVYNSVKFIPGETPVYYSGPYWDKNEVSAAIKSLILGAWLSSGEEVRKFEQMFGEKFNLKHNVMVNSGSSADLILIAALKKCLKWQDGDEVILSVVGFPTTLSALLLSNLKPVFIDIEFDTLNFDLELIESKITDKTKAIFLSPVLGNPCNMDRLVEICNKFNIKLLSDNCDSLGSSWRGKYLTDYAIASACSFYPAHHISTMEGGMVSSNYFNIVNTARSMVSWGRDCRCLGAKNLCSIGECGKRFSNWIPETDTIIDHKYLFTNMGYNLKPLDLQGSVGQIQMTKFDEIHKNRITSKTEIQKIFEKHLPQVRIVNELEHASTSWFGTPIICEDKEFKRKLIAFLEENKIQTRNYFAGNILLHPAYKHLDDWTQYPMANKVLDQVFFVGASPHYDQQIFDYFETVILKFKEKYGY